MEAVVCDEHIIAHVVGCKYCQAKIVAIFAAKAGSTKSEAKSEAARLNGLKGGRPKKVKGDIG